MSRVPDYMKRVVGWDRTTTQVGERKAEISHLDAHRLQLEGISQRYKDLNTQYKALSATRMELSQQMQQLFRQGETVVNFLRTGVRTHYGLNSEQLIAFDLVPTSRRAKPIRKAKQPVVPVPVPEPAK